MKRKILIIFVMVALSIILGACALLPAEDERLSPPIKKAKEVVYKTEITVYGDINKQIVLFASWTAANRVWYEYTVYNAPFLEYRVEKGDLVSPGDILAVLDIGEIDKNLRDMEISYQRAKLSYERVKEKYKAGLASVYDLRIVELDFEDVNNKYTDMKKRKADSLLRADLYGQVLSIISYNKGDMVFTGTNLVSIVEDDDIILKAMSSAIRSSNVKAGDLAILESSNQNVNGIVESIVSSTVTLKPDVMLEEWVLGSAVKITIPVSSVENVLIIDYSSVKSLSGQTYVRVLVNEIAVEKNVVLGIRSGRYIEVISGLEEGDEVILN